MKLQNALLSKFISRFKFIPYLIFVTFKILIMAAIAITLSTRIYRDVRYWDERREETCPDIVNAISCGSNSSLASSCPDSCRTLCSDRCDAFEADDPKGLFDERSSAMETKLCEI